LRVDVTITQHRQGPSEACVQLGRKSCQLCDNAGAQHRHSGRTDKNRWNPLLGEDRRQGDSQEKDGAHLTRAARQRDQASSPNEGAIARGILQCMGYFMGRSRQRRECSAIDLVATETYSLGYRIIVITDVRALDSYDLESMLIQKLSG
jgi:hypothetical protein